MGALDAIAGVVEVAVGLHALSLERLTAEPVTVGTGGTGRSEHGLVPVPAPAVHNLLAEAGAPVQGGPAQYEMCTPTGAALLAATASGWGPLPPMVPTRVGCGAGGRDLAELPTLLRLVVCEPVSAADTPVLLETGYRHRPGPRHRLHHHQRRKLPPVHQRLRMDIRPMAGTNRRHPHRLAPDPRRPALITCANLPRPARLLAQKEDAVTAAALGE